MTFAITPQGNGFLVTRDGKPCLSPAGHAYALPTRALAEVVAKSLEAAGKQKPKSRPQLHPHLQLAATALDIVTAKRDEVVQALFPFAETELLCHRAEHPAELRAEQEVKWQPILNWAADVHDIKLAPTYGLMPAQQPTASLARLGKILAAMDNFQLTGLRQAADVSGSIILGLALMSGYLTAGQVFDAAELDANFQIRQWGEDPATTERRKGVQRELQECESWFSLLKK